LAIDSIDEQAQDQPSAGVADIRQLCIQLQRAIAALASNDLDELEASTTAQDGLAEKLHNWFREKPSSPRRSARVCAADFRELANLTRVYSFLLQKALRTTRLRAALCQTYRQHFPSGSEPAAASGWSCEV
jgi:hypothetical protein